MSTAEFGRLWGPALDPTGATQVRNYPVGPAYPVTSTPTITAESGGGLAVSKSAKFPVDPSRVIDVTAKAPISKAAMGKAFKLAVGLSGGWLGIAFMAASEIAEWMNAANVRQKTGSTGFEFEHLDPQGCYTGSCYAYKYAVGGYSYPTYINRKADACSASISNANAQSASYTYSFDSWSGDTCLVNTYNKSSGAFVVRTGYAPSTQSRTPDPYTWVTASADDLANDMAIPTMKPGYLDRLLQTGVSVDASLPTLTGPSSVPGPSSSSSKQLKDAQGNVTGTQTVNKSTVYNITYNGNTYNVNAVTTTTTTNPDGTSTVETDSQAKPPEKDQPTDCDKYPESLGCSELDVPDGTIPKTSKNITYTAESWFGGGSCPADKFLTTHGQQIKVWDWTGSCTWLVNYFRPVLLIVASVMAMFIVLPKGAGV